MYIAHMWSMPHPLGISSRFVSPCSLLHTIVGMRMTVGACQNTQNGWNCNFEFYITCTIEPRLMVTSLLEPVFFVLMVCISFNFIFGMPGTAKFISSVVGGLIAGVALLVILYAAVKWRRKSPLCLGKL